jgi:hypothetical protein
MHLQIKRTGTELPDGIKTVTESADCREFSIKRNGAHEPL